MVRDLYGECNNKGMPLDEFSKGWCSRCMSPECSRSLYGKTKFDQRTATWLERLFLNPPTMSPDDPRYSSVSAQKFITIETGRTPEIRSDWVDPHQLVEPVETVPSVIVPDPVSISTSYPAPPVLRNAPDQSGTILPGGNPAQVKRDPWAAPEKSDDLIPVGATFRFGKGSDGV